MCFIFSNLIFSISIISLEKFIYTLVKYEWAQPLLYDFKPRMIVYHHTAVSNLTPKQIDEMHKNKGWAGIGYHFLKKYNITNLKRHKDVGNTECPGMNFPFEEIKAKLKV